MPKFMERFLAQVKNLKTKLTIYQKVLLGTLILFVGLAFAYLLVLSSDQGRVLLYKDGLQKGDFLRVKEKLDGLGVWYAQKSDRYLFVEDQETATKLRAQLGLDGVVRQLKGFELFDNMEFSTTDFERKVNLRRAITGNMVRHLEALDDIEKAEVTISYGQETPFYLREIEDNPLTAAVSLTLAPFSDLAQDKKRLKGLRDFIAKGIDRLKPKNVIIIDQHDGSVLSDRIEPLEADEKLRMAREQLRLQETIKHKTIQEIRALLSGIYTKDRYQLKVTVGLDWDSKKVFRKQIEPIAMKKDNPSTPYDESETILSAPRSMKKTKEFFKGPSFIPEGPPGTEPNVSPGMKELVDRYSDYKKEDEIVNNEFSEAEIQQEDAPYKIDKVQVAVVLDGVWEKLYDEDGNLKFSKEGKIQRVYKPVTVQVIKDIKNLLEGSLDKSRGDKVEVRHIAFDRRKDFEAEDEKIRNAMMNDRLILIGVAGFFGLLLLVLLLRLLQKELNRRRRLREEEFVKEQQRLREEALLAAEEESLELDMMPEDKERIEIQENVLTIARERPQEVAALLKTWLFEE